MKPVTLIEAEYVAHRLVVEMMNYDEPIADFSTRYPHKLESCLETPFQEFDGSQLYPDLYDKASLLFYLVIKNHPFENGNKRMAVMLMTYFLLINGKWVNTTPDDLYRVAMRIAESSPKDMQKMLEKLKVVMVDIVTDVTDKDLLKLVDTRPEIF